MSSPNYFVARMFGLHGEDRVIDFVKKAKYFHLRSALGGHANDPDMMFASFRIVDHDDLVNIALLLNIEFEKPAPGDDLNEHYHLGAHYICGYRFFIVVHDHMLGIYASNHSKNSFSYSLCNEDYDAALALEEKISSSYLASKAIPLSKVFDNDITRENVERHLGYPL